MAQKTDWLPSDRNGQLTMGRDWISILGTGGKAAAWNVPATAMTELNTVWSGAQVALTIAQNETAARPPILPCK